MAVGLASLLSSPIYAQTVTATTETVTVDAKPTDVLSRNIIGLVIRNSQDEQVGEIQDILVSQGSITGYIVSVGGFLGIGERYVIVSPSALKVTYSENAKKWYANMEITRENLKNSSPFKYEGRWSK